MRSHGLHLFTVLCLAVSLPVSLAQTTSRLVVRPVYRERILGAPDVAVPLYVAHLAREDRLLLVSKDDRLFMCDASNGHVLWDTKLADLIDEPLDLTHARVYCAWYEEGEVLGLLFDEVVRLYYLRYDRSGERAKPSLINENMGSFEGNALPIRGGHVLFPEGWAYRRSVHVFDLASRKMIRRLKPKPAKHPITALAFSDDGRYAAGAGDSVWVWELSSGKRLNDAYQPSLDVIKRWKLHGAGYRPTACAFSRDGKLLAVGTAGGKLLVFDVGSGKLLALEERAPHYWDSVEYLSFLGATHYVLGAGQSVQVYDFPKRRWLTTDAFRCDRSMLVTGGTVVCGKSVFVCDYVGNLRRFDWEVTGSPPNCSRSTADGGD